MVMAWRICDWKELFEISDHGNAWDVKPTKHGKAKGFKNGPLDYARYPVNDALLREGAISIGEKRVELEEAVGIDAMPIVEYVYWRMVGVAAFKIREYRGWVLTGRMEVMNVALIANRLHLNVNHVAYSLPWLKTLGWIAFEDCEFAKECGQPVRFGEENVKLGNLDSVPESPENLGNSGAPYKPNTNINTKLITDKARAENGGQNEIEEEKESDCLNLAAAEESESGSVVSGSADRGISGSVESESAKSVNTAGSSKIQSLKEASSGAGPNGEVVTSGQSMADGVLDWDMEIGRVNVERDDPSCLLKGLSDNKIVARERLIHCAVIWMQHLCPWLRPEEAMNGDEETQRTVNVRAVDTWANKAWNVRGENGVIEVILSMRKVWKEWKKPGRSNIRNPMAVWVRRIEGMLESESDCARQNGIEKENIRET